MWKLVTCLINIIGVNGVVGVTKNLNFALFAEIEFFVELVWI